MKKEAKLNYSATFKTKVVFELLFTQTTLQALSSKYQVSIQSLYRWKKQLLGSALVIFGAKKTVTQETKALKKLKQKRCALQQAIQKTENDIQQNQHAYEQKRVECQNESTLILPKQYHTKMKMGPFALSS